MKLKLETDGEITILAVSETIEAKQLPVLKAGLKKLFESNKKTIILDFTAVPAAILQADRNLMAELAVLPRWSQEVGAHLLLISAVEGMNGIPNRQLALEHLRNPLNRLLATENMLIFEVKAAERSKAEITGKLQTHAAELTKLKALKQENSRLKKKIRSLEERLQRQLAKHTRAAEPLTSMKQKNETLKSLLLTVLEQEGAITAH